MSGALQHQEKLVAEAKAARKGNTTQDPSGNKHAANEKGRSWVKKTDGPRPADETVPVGYGVSDKLDFAHKFRGRIS